MAIRVNHHQDYYTRQPFDVYEEQARQHMQRRDELMHAARTLKHWVDQTRAQAIPPRKMATPGAADTLQDCVSMARIENHLAMEAQRRC